MAEPSASNDAPPATSVRVADCGLPARDDLHPGPGHHQARLPFEVHLDGGTRLSGCIAFDPTQLAAALYDGIAVMLLKLRAAAGKRPQE